MKSRVVLSVGVVIVALFALGLAAIEVHHRLRFGHFVGYGVHADVVEKSSDIGIAGLRTEYAARVSNYRLLPLTLVGWEYRGDFLLVPPSFKCRFQLQKFSPQEAHWIVVIDFKPIGPCQVPAANKRLYPLGSLVPMESVPVGGWDAFRIGDLVRFAVFTNLYAATADVYTEPFQINEVPTIAPSPARTTR
jgi:hypothetical protein